MEWALRENLVLTRYSADQGLLAIEDLLQRKDRKLRQQTGAYAVPRLSRVLVLVFTDNWTIASADFFRAAQDHHFGPLQAVTDVFLVTEPFPGLDAPMLAAI